MKQYFFILACICIAASFLTEKLIGETIYGEGIVTFEMRDLPNFSKLVVNDSVHVYFGDIGEEIVKVQAEKNLLSSIYTKVEDSTLHVGMNKSIKPSKQINIYLGISHLSDITTNGTVLLLNERPLIEDSLKITANGISQIMLSRLQTKHLDVEINGSSTVHVKGTATEQHVVMRGATVYKALGLLTENTTISIAGAGKAWVNANNQLNATLTGAAYLGYDGEPEIQRSIMGVGRLEEVPTL